MNILEIYKLFLRVVSNKKPTNFSQLLNFIESDEAVINLRNKVGDQQSIDYLQDVLENLIKENLINGSVLSTKDGRVFSIERLSPVGYTYLEKLEEPKFWNRFKKHAKENGISPSVKNITQLMANLLVD